MSAAGCGTDAAEYVRQITAHESDRRYRRSFQRLALQLAPAGSAVFDFGSGPGIDARFYAEHGHHVVTFDTDPAMSEYLICHCRDLIARGAVAVHNSEYRDFLQGATPREPPQVGLITANFAPLNLIDNLHELFVRFAQLTAPEGAVLASVLNPYFVGDLRYAWWWRNAGTLVGEGRYAVAGARGCIWRRRLANFAAQCGPHFVLEQVFPGNRTDVRASAPGVRLRLLGCRYMFLLFRKRAAHHFEATGSLSRAR